MQARFGQTGCGGTPAACPSVTKISPTSTVPNGFLGKVFKITTQAGLVAVTTTRVTLADEYSSYGASLNVAVNGASLQTQSAVPGVRLTRPAFDGRAVTSPAAFLATLCRTFEAGRLRSISLYGVAHPEIVS